MISLAFINKDNTGNANGTWNTRTYINYCGKPNSGKSTVLCFVIDMLKKIGTVIAEKKNRGKDRRIVIEIKDQRVAICTSGDDIKHLLENHHWFDEHSPKIMVTASHAHENHDHNLFIDNYVHNEITADNEPNKYRGHFNYFKIQSVPCKIDYDRINNIYAEYICHLIFESLNI